MENTRIPFTITAYGKSLNATATPQGWIGDIATTRYLNTLPADKKLRAQRKLAKAAKATIAEGVTANA